MPERLYFESMITNFGMTNLGMTTFRTIRLLHNSATSRSSGRRNRWLLMLVLLVTWFAMVDPVTASAKPVALFILDQS